MNLDTLLAAISRARWIAVRREWLREDREGEDRIKIDGKGSNVVSILRDGAKQRKAKKVV